MSWKKKIGSALSSAVVAITPVLCSYDFSPNLVKADYSQQEVITETEEPQEVAPLHQPKLEFATPSAEELYYTQKRVLENSLGEYTDMLINQLKPSESEFAYQDLKEQLCGIYDYFGPDLAKEIYTLVFQKIISDDSFITVPYHQLDNLAECFSPDEHWKILMEEFKENNYQNQGKIPLSTRDIHNDNDPKSRGEINITHLVDILRNQTTTERKKNIKEACSDKSFLFSEPEREFKPWEGLYVSASNVGGGSDSGGEVICRWLMSAFPHEFEQSYLFSSLA